MIESTQTDDQETLREQLRSARERVGCLVDELHAVDRDLNELETERKHFGLLQSACASLEALDEMGAADLFWRGHELGGNAADHLQIVRNRIEHFEKRLGEIEDRRHGLLDEIELQEVDADFIAGDVLEAERLVEQKKLEWEIERDLDELPIHPSIMPWTRGGEDDQRFRKALAISLLISLLFCFLLPFIDIPIPERWRVLEEQNRLTQLIREERKALTPPVEVVQAQPVQPEETVPTEEPQAPVVAKDSTPTPAMAPAAKPRATASRGILAFRKEFSSLKKDRALDRLGSNARIHDTGTSTAGLPERSMVTTTAPGSSGGINIAKLSRGMGGTGERMDGVDVTKATSTIGSGQGSDRPLAGGGPGLSRTDEDIQIVFDRHKSALYRLYNRELRKNPTLKGQIVLRLIIAPDGSVTLCELKSTNMKAPELARKIVDRVKTFDFGAKDGIPPVTIVYPIDFLPAA